MTRAIASNIKRLLQPHIRGKIIAQDRDDYIIIKIVSYDIVYETRIQNVSTLASHGYSSKYWSKSILDDYEDFIIERYFK